MNDSTEQPGELAHLEPLPELPPESEPQPTAAAPRGTPTGPSAAALAARAQERAPQLLKTASKVLVAGGVLPWLPLALDGNGPWINLGCKLIVLAGCWQVLRGVRGHYAFQAQLAAPGSATAAPAAGADVPVKPLVPGKKGMVGALNMLHVVGAVLIVVGLICQAALLSDLKAIGEGLAVLLGGLTFAHIVSYEKGGKFSPLYPLMFLGCALGGAAALVGALGQQKWLTVLGAVVVTIAGVLAVYTIAVAMMQAKKDGDIKKAAALEARKQARDSKRSGGGRAAPRA